jgi:hypothetical protein
MDAHPYVYHRNICIHHCVHEVVDSEYPGKKQRLNMRIYFDRNNHYLYSNVYIHQKYNAFEVLLFKKMYWMTNNFLFYLFFK